MTKAYAVPTHRRSNTAASFVPTMTLKQFQDQKTAINNNRKQLNQSQVSSFDQRASAADKANVPAAENVGSLSASRMGAADRLPINNSHSKSTTLSTLKKFEVIRRDKS